MKLAEALQERADLNMKIAQLRGRLDLNSTVQEGETPAEDPKELLEELNSSVLRLEELISSINLTNSKTLVDGLSLTELIAKKDCLSVKIDAYRDFLCSSSRLSQRASGREIKIISTVNVKDIQKNVDALSKELRRIDNLIQQTNWTTEL